MIQSALRLTILVNRLNIFRSISGIQNLLLNTNNNKLNTEDDEKLCEDIISATKKFRIGNEDVSTEADKMNSYLMSTNVHYRLKYYLNCTEDQSKNMVKENRAIEELPMSKLRKSLEHLYDYGISAKSIINNSFLITMDEGILRKKMDILKRFKGCDIDDLVPLLFVSPIVLNRACRIQETETKKGIPNANRIAYMSKALKVEPELVAKYFSTHMFIFGIPPDMLEENLKTLLEYGIEPIHILRDLWVFKYVPKKLKDRFELVKAAGRTTLRPWMVRCKMDVLEHSIDIYQQNKKLLGEDTVVDYLSKRLGYDTFLMKTIASKHPGVLKCRGNI